MLCVFNNCSYYYIKLFSCIPKVRLLACKSEAWLGLSEQERALDCIGQAKQLLVHVSQTERSWVSVLCYNLGLDLYKQGGFNQCISWLKESYEIGRQGHCMEPTKQARTLRLIAIAYLESDSVNEWLKALNTVELSLTEHVHPSGLFLKLRVLLRGREVAIRIMSTGYLRNTTTLGSKKWLYF